MSRRNKIVSPSEVIADTAAHAANVATVEAPIVEAPPVETLEGVTPENVKDVQIASLEKENEKLRVKLAKFNLDNEISNAASIIGQLLPDKSRRMKLLVSLKNKSFKDLHSGDIKELSESQQKALKFAADYGNTIEKLLTMRAEWSSKTKWH